MMKEKLIVIRDRVHMEGMDDEGGAQHLLLSVANSWPNFSARSTKKFGRWRKNSAPYKIFSLMLILLCLHTISLGKGNEKSQIS
jgi:hypothetical protein